MSDQGENYLSQFVGEGKKYTNEEELAKAYSNADAHIEKILQEKRELEDKLNNIQSQESKLDTIVNALKTEPIDNIPEVPLPEPEKKVEPVAVQEPDVNKQLKMNEFARKAVDTFGDAVTVGNKINEYTQGDPDKVMLVNTLMGADPEGLLRIINPSGTEAQPFNPTSSSGKTNSEGGVSLPMTGAEAMKVMKEDRKKYQSPEFQKLLRESVTMANAKGIEFWKD